ncbi:MAG: ribosome maturation factor RimP [Nitrospira sp.]|nr:ribosome maturation factor RimP [Nitrospira sp.]MDH4236288.1 ribosome maturation factor RimP [Nitrospira sp.]MDH4328456.1 ribosome maturation factor RimP [Nitrospira sp.]MDH5252899.1 ribosome maturation factor RimP [Nitrospira sp.]MDH5624701.1 ribosome maturation factor RimP [Nitrospira sp.]
MSTQKSGAQSVVDRMQEVISPILWALKLELVEVVCVGQGPRSVVRVLIDKPGGVTVTDCERAHKALGPALDMADPFPHAYTLEVSSPGLDRPFKCLQDYQRAIGKEVSLKLRQPLNGQWRVIGRLAEADEQAVSLTLSMGRAEPQMVRVEREQIADARLFVKI